MSAQLYSIPATAAKLSVSARMVDKLLATGQLRSVKIGMRRLIPESAIAAYIAMLENESDVPA